MAKSTKVKNRKTKTPNRPGRELNNVKMSCFIFGMRLTVLSGRRILKVLSALSPLLSIIGRKLRTDEHTTKKSSQFQGSRKYDFSWKMKPFAIILSAHSRMKITVNTRSTFSSWKFLSDQYEGP